MGQKRTRDEAMGDRKHDQPSGPYTAMFEGFRKDLDEHQDRRERIVKASRDITAASKKIIFTLQRVRGVGQALPAFVGKSNAQYWETIGDRYKTISPDVQGINAYRYPNLGWGSEEFVEALSFQHYLETQTLISYEESKARIASMSQEGSPVLLTPENYLLGIYDTTGEIMRFAVTSMAMNGELPAPKPKKEHKSVKESSHNQGADAMDIDQPAPASSQDQPSRNVLTDLRELRLQLEYFETPSGGPFHTNVEKKIAVMRQSVDKVENALYSLNVRGQERPKGWMPDLRENQKAEVESY